MLTRFEIADALIRLARPADVPGVALLATARVKPEVNARKHPLAKARGAAGKPSRRDRL